MLHLSDLTAYTECTFGGLQMKIPDLAIGRFARSHRLLMLLGMGLLVLLVSGATASAGVLDQDGGCQTTYDKVKGQWYNNCPTATQTPQCQESWNKLTGNWYNNCPTATSTPYPTRTRTSTPTPTPCPTRSRTSTPTPCPTRTRTSTPTPCPTRTRTSTPTPCPTRTRTS